jgi:hypothetical protein
MLILRSSLRVSPVYWLLACGVLAGALAIGGCDRKEKLLDVETPWSDIEVERDRTTGRVEVDVDDRS